jgi:hypothetical protein
MLCGATKSDVAPQPERRSPRAAAIFFHRRSSFFVVFPRGRGKDISPFVVFAPCARKGEARRSSDSDQRPRPRRWCEPHRRRQPSSSSAFCLLPSAFLLLLLGGKCAPSSYCSAPWASALRAGCRWAATKGRRPGRLLHPVRLLVVLARAGRRTTSARRRSSRLAAPPRPCANDTPGVAAVPRATDRSSRTSRRSPPPPTAAPDAPAALATAPMIGTRAAATPAAPRAGESTSRSGTSAGRC